MGIFNRANAKPNKSKPDFSNVTSGDSSSAPAPVEDAPASRRYTVQKGDSLSKIALAYYGDANEWPRIYSANRDTIKDPDLIHPGQILTIPNA